MGRNDFIYRKKTRIVPLGDSLRSGMGIPIGGPNGDELALELENFAASEIMLGVWNQDGAHQRKADVTSAFSFWLERNPDQRVFWQPEMTISQEYYDAIHKREMTPFAWPALIELSHNARAMDIHAFLTCRLHKGLPRPVHLSRPVLHGMFGQGIKEERSHWQQFKNALILAHKQYPTARVEITKDGHGEETGLTLKNSPLLISHRKMPRLS